MAPTPKAIEKTRHIWENSAIELAVRPARVVPAGPEERRRITAHIKLTPPMIPRI